MNRRRRALPVQMRVQVISVEPDEQPGVGNVLVVKVKNTLTPTPFFEATLIFQDGDLQIGGLEPGRNVELIVKAG